MNHVELSKNVPVFFTWPRYYLTPILLNLDIIQPRHYLILNHGTNYNNGGRQNKLPEKATQVYTLYMMYVYM